MLFLLFIFYLFRWRTLAIPLPSDLTSSVSSASGTGIIKRTTYSIVWSCLSTVFICAWVSVHPNVPPRSQSRALWRRLKLMFWTIIVPELVLAWAVRQWSGARMIKNMYKGHGWTMMHGHFLIMGGFTLVHAHVDLPKEPKKPKLSFSFRFWRNANDGEHGGTDGVQNGFGEQGSEHRSNSEGQGSEYAEPIFFHEGSTNSVEPRIHSSPRSSTLSIRSPVSRRTYLPTVIQPIYSPGPIYPPGPIYSPRPIYSPVPMSPVAVSPESRSPQRHYVFSSERPSIANAGSDNHTIYRGSSVIPKIWRQEDEDEWRRSEEEKKHYEKGKQSFEADRQRYQVEYQHYMGEEVRYQDEKRLFEKSQRGEKDRRQYEKSRQRFEEVRQAYEEMRYLFEESRRLYQDIRQTYRNGRRPSKEIKRHYGEIRQSTNGEEMQKSYEKAKALYQEQTERHDKQREKYVKASRKCDEARRSYEEARKYINDTRRRNRGRKRPVVDERRQRHSDSGSEKITYLEEKKRLYREEEERYEKARKLYKEEGKIYDEATERHQEAEARYTQKIEDMTEEARQRNTLEEEKIQEEDRQYEEDRRQYTEERERYEETRQRYERERGLYEEERMGSEAIQHAADELERRQYEIERQQYEERRLQFEDEWCNEEQKLRRYEEELHRYEGKLREYEEICKRYQLGRPLSLDHFQRLIHESKIDFPKVTIEEIKDKSKADFLSKIIAILQTTWFLFQCITRGVQGLAITELELVTLALASLNMATYACWWNKPLGVQDPYRIYLKVDVEETKVAPMLLQYRGKAPEATVRRVLNTIGRLLAKVVKVFLDTFGNPFEGGGNCCGHYFLLIWIPGFVLLLVAFSIVIILSLFPLAIAALLTIIKPKPPHDAQ